MPPAPPPAASTALPPPLSDDLVTAIVASQLGMALPPECVPGVRDNLALLASHWENLRGFPLPGDDA